jgi:invasion protein IalB
MPVASPPVPLEPARAARLLAALFGIVTSMAALVCGPLAPDALAQQPKTQQPPAQQPPGQQRLIPGGGRDGQEFQDWKLHCGHAQGQTAEICEMRQTVVDANKKPVLLAIVGRLPNRPDPGLVMILPLGISIPPGVALKIDQGQEGRAQVTRCLAQGCQVEVLLNPDVLASFKAGTKATVGFQVTDPQGKQQRIDVPLSLLGFSAALGEVMK